MPQHPLTALRVPARLALASLALVACKPQGTASHPSSDSPITASAIQALKDVHSYRDWNSNGPADCDAQRCEALTVASPKVWGRQLGIQPEDWEKGEERTYYYGGRGARINVAPFAGDTWMVRVEFDEPQQGFIPKPLTEAQIIQTAKMTSIYGKPLDCRDYYQFNPYCTGITSESPEVWGPELGIAPDEWKPTKYEDMNVTQFEGRGFSVFYSHDHPDFWLVSFKPTEE